jgi:hypothetical protein
MPSNSGKALDSADNIQVDFVWGNFPMQPNDVRTTASDVTTVVAGTNPVTTTSKRLVPGLDNHDIVLGGWNGYPSYTPNNRGEFTQTSPVYVNGLSVNTPYIVVPNVLGLNGSNADLTPAKSSYKTVGLGANSAQDGLRDSGYQDANIKVDGTAQPNASKTITTIAFTAGTATVPATAVITTSGISGGASSQFPAGVKVSIVTGTGIPASLVGTWDVTASDTATLTLKGPLSTVSTPWVATDNVGSLTTAALKGATSTVFSQTVAPGADTITGTADITIKLYA